MYLTLITFSPAANAASTGMGVVADLNWTTLIAAGLGASLTYLATSRRDSRAAEREQAQWLRNRRLETYSKFSAVIGELTSYVHVTDDGTIPDKAATPKRLTALSAAVEEVGLVGPPRIYGFALMAQGYARELKKYDGHPEVLERYQKAMVLFRSEAQTVMRVTERRDAVPVRVRLAMLRARVFKRSKPTARRRRGGASDERA